MTIALAVKPSGLPGMRDPGPVRKRAADRYLKISDIVKR
jgi:hypothetical protein